MKKIFAIILFSAILPALAQEGPTVPARYENVIPKINPQSDNFFANLIYEGNNIDMRGALSTRGLFELDGRQVAERWRNLAPKTRAIFVIRESLFSQQDHPYRHDPYALVLPANWITAAVISENRKPLNVFPVDDDDSWVAIASAEALFGSFPKSEGLFKVAIKSLKNKSASERAQISNARKTLLVLSEYSKQLIDAANKRIPEEIMKVGAELMAASDIRYFTKEIRRKHIIPIFVENPMKVEIKEGKGYYLFGREVDKMITDNIGKFICRRRLEDGDIAIERYDLSNEKEIERAIAVLEAIIPKGETGEGKVWLWVTGRLTFRNQEDTALSGEDASRHIDHFRAKIAGRNIEQSRLRFVNKPAVEIPRDQNRQAVFESAVDRFNELNLPMSVNFTSAELIKIMER